VGRRGPLVAFNARYRDQYSFAPDMLRPGVSYEEIIRESVRRGMVPVGYDAEEWVRSRIEQHRNPGGAFLVQRKDGRWTMITEYRTQEGGIVGIRTDVTRLRASEEAAKAAQRRLMEAIEAVPQGL
jgi:PAS domain-containing protein